MKRRATRRFLFWTAATTVGLVLCLVVGPPATVRRAFSVFSSIGQLDEYIATGVIEEERLNDIFRFEEARIVLSSMSPAETCLGTGLGGYIVDDRLAVVEAMPEVPGGRSGTHMGILWFFLKGGLALGLCYYGLIFTLLSRFKRYKGDRLRTALWGFLGVMVLFQLIEGHWMGPTMDATAFLVGGCIGTLCTSPRSIDENPLYRRLPLPFRIRCRESH